LPPVTAEEGTGRIVDGWHRVRAHDRLSLAVPTDFWRYESEAELLQHAVALNTSHGLRLNRADLRRVVHLLGEAGVAENEIATVLRVTPSRVRQLALQVAVVAAGAGQDAVVVPLKRSTLALAGKTLDAEEVEAVRRSPGTSYSLLVRQLRDALRFGWLDREDQNLMEALRALRDELMAFLE